MLEMMSTLGGGAGSVAAYGGRLRALGRKLAEIAIIDDNAADARNLTAHLNVLTGYEVNITHFKSMLRVADYMRSSAPDLVFLDDILPPNDNALKSIPYLRKCGYGAPIIVWSGCVTRERSRLLREAGGAMVLDKDELTGDSVAEVILQVLGRPA